MIKVKTKSDGSVSIIVKNVKDAAQLIGEIGITIKALVVCAMEGSKSSVQEETAMALTIGEIFDRCIERVKDILVQDFGDKTETFKINDYEFHIDLNDLDELVRQMKEIEKNEDDPGGKERK